MHQNLLLKKSQAHKKLGGGGQSSQNTQNRPETASTALSI
jgi:hypothetical protein